jgi:hypothetical protein
MKLERRIYSRGEWSSPLPAELDGPQTLVIAFSAPELRASEAWSELASAFPRAVRAGCSSSGEIADDQVHDESVSVAIARFDRTPLRRAVASISDASDSETVGASLGASLQRDDLRAVVVLSDGLQVNGTALSRGLQRTVGDDVVVTGGLAGDGARFGETWVWNGTDAPQPGQVMAIGLYGDAVQVGHGSRGGWDAFGPPRKVTASDGNVLHTLDGRPALALYKEYLGERASGLPATALLFPLALRDPARPDHELVRTILAVDEDTQSMTFAGDLPEGSEVQLMRANFERLVDGAAGAADLTLASLGEGDEPVLALAISCVGRRLVLGDATEDEVEATFESFPEGSVQVGFYSYGELSPTTTTGCELHNQTMTLTALRERS